MSRQSIGFIVALDHEMDGVELERTVAAIMQIKGVVGVEEFSPDDDPGLIIGRMRAKNEMRERIMRWLNELS